MWSLGVTELQISFALFEEARNRTADAQVKVQMEAATILPVFVRVAYVCLHVGAVAVLFDLFSC